MNQRIAEIAIIVKDYDEAIAFYVNKLNFDLIEDTKVSDVKRWVRIAPKGSGQCGILLAKAKNETQLKSVGNQTGGRVLLFLYTDDFYRDYNRMVEKGVKIHRQPSEEDFGTVCVFADLYGNLWDFIQPK